MSFTEAVNWERSVRYLCRSRKNIFLHQHQTHRRSAGTGPHHGNTSHFQRGRKWGENGAICMWFPEKRFFCINIRQITRAASYQMKAQRVDPPIERVSAKLLDREARFDMYVVSRAKISCVSTRETPQEQSPTLARCKEQRCSQFRNPVPNQATTLPDLKPTTQPPHDEAS